MVDESWEDIALMHARAGNIGDALKIYREKLNMPLVPKELLLLWGDEAMRNKKYKGAIKAYRIAQSYSRLNELYRHLRENGFDSLAEEASAILVTLSDFKTSEAAAVSVDMDK